MIWCARWQLNLLENHQTQQIYKVTDYRVSSIVADDKTCLCEDEDLSWASIDAVIMFKDGKSGRITRAAGTSCGEMWLEAFLETYSQYDKVKQKKKH